MDVLITNFKYAQKLIPLTLSGVEYIILHHIGESIATPEQIHKYHLNNSWAGFGYNEYIKKDGTVYIGRGDNIGAQCSGMNSKSYGIAVEGNYEIENDMPEAQKQSLVARIRVNRRRFVNFKCVVPHYKFYSTSCPGEHFPLSEILQRIEVNDVITPQEHWAEKIYKELTEKHGLVIHEKRFDDKITRGETMALILQALASLKQN